MDMKKILSILLVLLLTLTACQSGQMPTQPQNPGSNGASRPTSEKPPLLQIRDGAGQSAEAVLGTYSWMYDRGNGIWTGVEADSLHPLQMQEYLTPFVTADDTIELLFDVPPQEIAVRCWSDSSWDDPDAPAEEIPLDENKLELKSGGYIYEVTARWTGENLAAEGTAYYGFYVIKDDHRHTLAEQPQIVEDPVTGYCGNTMTTIVLDGKEYTFMGSDSVNLTDILINLKYDPMHVCRCAPEFTVKTEFGEPYGVNLSQGYARSEEGQADLTKEQIEKIQEILDTQT